MITKLSRQQCRLINQAIRNSTDEHGRAMIYPLPKIGNLAKSFIVFGDELTLWYNTGDNSTHIAKEKVVDESQI